MKLFELGKNTVLTWFRNRWPDPRIAEREEELRRLVERHEVNLKEWKRGLDRAAQDHIQTLRDLDEARAKHKEAEGRALKAESPTTSTQLRIKSPGTTLTFIFAEMG